MILIYITAAIVPALFLMHYVYEKDTLEKEPASLLWKLVFSGWEAVGISLVLEMIMDDMVLPSFSYPSETIKVIVQALCIGLIEEGSKLVFLYRRTWNNPNFNYIYDGIVYAVFVSLGFALLENVFYVFSYGLSVAFSRALLAIPAHMGFAVFMGTYYGSAKLFDIYGLSYKKGRNLTASYLSSVFLHAFYDASAMIETGLSTVIFLLFVIVMYFIVIRKIKKSSQMDRKIF